MRTPARENIKVRMKEGDNCEVRVVQVFTARTALRDTLACWLQAGLRAYEWIKYI